MMAALVEASAYSAAIAAVLVIIVIAITDYNDGSNI